MDYHDVMLAVNASMAAGEPSDHPTVEQLVRSYYEVRTAWDRLQASGVSTPGLGAAVEKYLAAKAALITEAAEKSAVAAASGD